MSRPSHSIGRVTSAPRTSPAEAGQAESKGKIGPARFSGAGSPWSTLAWACFLGCSWTWVIGMVWPAMLLRDYGPWGWLAFAVPNVLGAAAMGWALGTPARSRRFVERHAKMAARFSLCTIGFHCFVLGWLMPALFGWLIVPIVMVAALGLWIGVRSDPSAMVIAVIITLICLACLGIGVTAGASDAWTGFMQPQTQAGSDVFNRLLWLSPGLIVGFALCPYLDLTFHRARQATAPRTGKGAFGFGFGGIFLLMILGSLAYGALLWPALRGGPAQLPDVWMWVLAVHLVVQMAWTLALHISELLQRSPGRALPRIVLVAGTAFILGALVGQPAMASSGPLANPSISPITAQGAPPLRTAGESVYRIFLLAYAVIFPAYVWLCAIPTIRDVPPRRRKIVFLLAVMVTLPLAYLVLVLGQTLWTIPALGLLGLARLALELSPAIKARASQEA